MLGIVYVVLGLFLMYQGVGTLGFIDGFERLVLPALDKNLYCFMAGVAVGKFGIIVGLTAILLGIVYFFTSKKSEEVKNDNTKGKLSYFGIAVLYGVLSVVSIL